MNMITEINNDDDHVNALVRIMDLMALDCAVNTPENDEIIRLVKLLETYEEKMFPNIVFGGLADGCFQPLHSVKNERI